VEEIYIMNKKIGLSRLVITGGVMAAVLLSGCGNSNNAGSGANNKTEAKKQMAPDFTADMLDGSTFTLSEAKGKVVLINIWATWCGPCCGEMPAFQKLDEEYGDKLQIVAVNYAEKRGDVKAFMDENGYTFPVAFDDMGEISAKYPSQGIPYTIIIDKEGAISKTFVGAQSADVQYDLYKKAIEEAMNEK